MRNWRLWAGWVIFWATIGGLAIYSLLKYAPR